MTDHDDAREVDGSFVAPFVLSYPYSRTPGTVIGRFLEGLAAGRVEGTRSADGAVHVPPAEFDPHTGAALTEWVTVGGEGVVTTWTWQLDPGDDGLLDHPFAWALIRLDGASTAMLHAVDVASPEDLATGDRVRIRWSPERTGTIRDIACFEKIDGG